MNSFKVRLAAVLFLFLFQTDLIAQTSFVEKYGQLSVKGNYIMSERGDTVQLRGMSFFWSQWMWQYYNPGVVKWLKEDWKCSVIRIAMGVENPPELCAPPPGEVLSTLVTFKMFFAPSVIISFFLKKVLEKLASSVW